MNRPPPIGGGAGHCREKKEEISGKGARIWNWNICYSSPHGILSYNYFSDR
jgi:hypothetical protein